MTAGATVFGGYPGFPLHVLRDYALLADGERGILVGPRGEHAWMCAPTWDSEAVFGTLIGGAGVYAVTPQDTTFVWGGHYEPATLIWRDRWITGSAGGLRPAPAHQAALSRRGLAGPPPGSGGGEPSNTRFEDPA